MKVISFCLLALLCCFVCVDSRAQSGAVKDSPTTQKGESKDNKSIAPDVNESRPAALLFEEADNYTQKKFAEFEKLKMPFDKQLEEKIKQEQRDLAARHAATLATRKLIGQEVYYLGLLYNLARNFDSALTNMQRFLNENPQVKGEPAQNARAIVVIQAAKKGLLPEAEARLKDYANGEPQVAEDRHSLENWLTVSYFNLKDYERALPHAKQMWIAAQQSAKQKSPFERDATLSNAVVTLSEIYMKLKKDDEAIAVVQELREMALALPSGNLYKLALRRMIQISPDPFKTVEADRAPAAAPPEISANEWIDHSLPKKLSDLRGRVVLLDFWAPWCGPCQVTLPRFQKWHDTYKNKGLVIIGLTGFEGRAEGKELTREQELDYLRGFKKKFGLTYGFAISDSEDNDLNYAVASIPTTFLIDRRGVVRFISIGASDLEAAALNKMIKRLIDEPIPTAAPTGQ